MAMGFQFLPRQPHRLPQSQPGFQATVSRFRAVLVENAPQPELSHLPHRAVGENGRVFERNPRLVIVTVGNPATNLRRSRPPLVEQSVEGMMNMIKAPLFQEFGLEHLPGPGSPGAERNVVRHSSYPCSNSLRNRVRGRVARIWRTFCSWGSINRSTCSWSGDLSQTGSVRDKSPVI